MVSATLLSALALAATAATPANAFSSVGNTSPRGGVGPLYVTDDASAQALSDYMAKSHEEKLRAVKDVEQKKNSEIQALKSEIAQLQSSSALATTAPAPAAPLANVGTAEMEAKLASYQSFMAEYIVNAQNQKLLAVKEAELNAEKKFQEKLAKLFDGMALPEGAGVAAADAAVVVEETPFQSRNAQIIAAGAKSRWGSMEIERAIEQVKSAPVPAAAATTPTAFDARNAQVAAAGAKSRWGSMEVEKAAATATSSAPPAVEATSFDARNAQVAAAGAKSRWGSMEVEKATAASANGATAVAAPVKEEKKPVSLEDRVNLGARLLGV